MSTVKSVTERLEKIKAMLSDGVFKNNPRKAETFYKRLQKQFNELPSDDKKNLQKRVSSTIARLEAQKEKPKGPNIANRAMGGSMGGGMNPMGRSKDPTVESIVGYNPNRPNRMKKGGFPDMTGDGKVTKADILKGRGVFKKGGMAKGSREGSIINTRTAFKKGGAIKRRGGGIAKRGMGIAK